MFHHVQALEIASPPQALQLLHLSAASYQHKAHREMAWNHGLLSPRSVCSTPNSPTQMGAMLLLDMKPLHAQACAHSAVIAH